MLKSDRISKRRSVSILLGIGLICWGILWGIGQFYAISIEMEWANAHPNHSFSDISKRSILGQIWNYHHNLMVSLLTLIAGVALLFRKKNRMDLSFRGFGCGNYSFCSNVCDHTCRK
jgi:hypothetical protein